MTTLAVLRTRARQRANMELGAGQSDTDHFITNAELNAFINASAAELYDLILAAYDGDYYLTSTTFTSTASNLEYSLPVDFYKLKGLERQISGDVYEDIAKFNFKDRNKGGLRYRLRGANIRFTQVPEVGQTYRLWYVPTATVMSADGDAFEGINGFEEYIVIDAAIKMLVKEESDPSALMSEKASIKMRIDAMAADRDTGENDSISDMRNSSLMDFYGWEMYD